MKKSELKNGAVVETRNGFRYIKVNDTLIGVSDMISGYMLLQKYDSHLFFRGNSEWDIIKVHNDVKNPHGGIANSIIEVSSFNRWTWVRKEGKAGEDSE